MKNEKIQNFSDFYAIGCNVYYFFFKFGFIGCLQTAGPGNVLKTGGILINNFTLQYFIRLFTRRIASGPAGFFIVLSRRIQPDT